MTYIQVDTSSSIYLETNTISQSENFHFYLPNIPERHKDYTHTSTLIDLNPIGALIVSGYPFN